MLSKMQAISSFMTIHAMAQLGKTASIRYLLRLSKKQFIEKHFRFDLAFGVRFLGVL
jgi:uncharacterized membrane protein YadS